MAPPPPRVSAAMNAMSALGFSWETTKPVLKRLLTVYDNKWTHIEAENYRVLADAILDSLESRESGLNKDKHLSGGNKMVDDKDCTQITRHRDDKASDTISLTSFDVCVEEQMIDKSEPEKKKLRFSTRERGESIKCGVAQPFIAKKSGEIVLAQPLSSYERNGVASLQNSTIKILPQTLPNEICSLRRDRKAKQPVHRTLDKLIYKVENINGYNMQDSVVTLPYQGHQKMPIHDNSNKEIASISKCNITNPSICVDTSASHPSSMFSEITSSSSRGTTPKGFASQDMIPEVTALLANGKREYTNDNNKNSGDVEKNSLSLVLFKPPQHANSEMGIAAVLDSYDITRGEENVQISLKNGLRADHNMPSFQYIAKNIIYQNAYVNISLARIGDENCCSGCTGDCLAAPIPCACARETGGEYAYTSENLMKEEFLDSIISMKYHWQQKDLFFCKDCPVGGIGIVPKSYGKGLGVRTLEELPRGAFVCEYVGEILTNTELYFRQLHVTGKMRHTYPVLLDADWGAEQVLKDEEALCLDATFYGNVARFINHRCADANLIEVPVEIETPDHHYYHLAFFTVRKVEAFEELTWVGGQGTRPTFFEMAAAQQLPASLRAALSYSFGVIVSTCPSCSSFLPDLCFHRGSGLKETVPPQDASFSESLYGLRRRSIKASASRSTSDVESNSKLHISSLRKRQKVLSVVFLVVLPYLKSKLHSIYNKEREARLQESLWGNNDARLDDPYLFDQGDTPQTRFEVSTLEASNLTRIKKKIMATIGLSFSYQLLYLLDATRFYAPGLHALGIHVCRATGQELMDSSSKISRIRSGELERLRGPLWLKTVQRLLLSCVYTTLDYAQTGLIAAVFFFKMMEWWYQSAEERMSAPTVYPPPPPPPPPKVAEDGIPLPPDRTLCPLCFQKRVNPSVVSVSGFVFCYSCIFKYVSQYKRCPVTLLPATVEQIRRLFHDL
ncbi:Peroxisome biogenesis protein 12 [Apostasia shenzhenica]|uniref:Peroxin-12 n=1 Tax=Apostasia shenzhenica TaxID=1088818 RepID=A0A2I0BBE8_9ASPA|nr:Peroxisome biogenesis protein 12 [Apostasia shenzhenica]